MPRLASNPIVFTGPILHLAHDDPPFFRVAGPDGDRWVCAGFLYKHFRLPRTVSRIQLVLVAQFQKGVGLKIRVRSQADSGDVDVEVHVGGKWRPTAMLQILVYRVHAFLGPYTGFVELYYWD